MKRIFEELNIGDTFYLNYHGVQLVMTKAGLDRGLYLPIIKPETEVELIQRLTFDIELLH